MCGKTQYTKSAVAKVASDKEVPPDWCYIYNFEDSNEPIAVSLPAGEGRAFKEVMEAFVNAIKKDLKLTFNNEDYVKERALIRQKFDEKKNVILEQLNSKSMKHGFQVKSTRNRYLYDACFRW